MIKRFCTLTKHLHKDEAGQDLIEYALVTALIAFGAIWPILLATIHGFAAVEPRLYEVASALRLSRPAVIFKIAPSLRVRRRSCTLPRAGSVMPVTSVEKYR